MTSLGLLNFDWRHVTTRWLPGHGAVSGLLHRVDPTVPDPSPDGSDGFGTAILRFGAQKQPS